MHEYSKQLRQMEFPLSSEDQELLLAALLREIVEVEGVSAILSSAGRRDLGEFGEGQVQLKNQGVLVGEQTLQVDIFLEVHLDFPTGKVGIAVQKAAGKLVGGCLPPDVRHAINVHVLRIAD